MVYLGLHHKVDDFQFRPVYGVGNKVRCRGQISPHKGKLVYWMEIRELGFDATTGFPYAVADVNIIDIDFEKGQAFSFSNEQSLLALLNLYGKGDLARKIVVDFQGVALQMEGTATQPPAPLSPVPTNGGLHLTGGFRGPSPPAKYMRWGLSDQDGAYRSVSEALTWHPCAGVDGAPTPGFTPTVYPPAPNMLCTIPWKS